MEHKLIITALLIMSVNLVRGDQPQQHDVAKRVFWKISPSEVSLGKELSKWRTGALQRLRDLAETVEQFRQVYSLVQDRKYARVGTLRSSRYRLSEIGLSWKLARAVCQAEDADLVAIETRTEDRALDQLVKKTQLSGAWTSGTDAKKEGRWVWASTDKALFYKNWDTGEPNNSGGKEHCLEKGHTRKSVIRGYEWNDDQCERVLPFICEKRKK